MGKQKKRRKHRNPQRPPKSIWRRTFFVLVAVCCAALVLSLALTAILTQRKMILDNPEVLAYKARTLELLCFIPAFVNATVLLGIFYLLYESDITLKSLPSVLAQRWHKRQERKKKKWYPKARRAAVGGILAAAVLLAGFNAIPYAAFYVRTEATREGIFQYGLWNQINQEHYYDQAEAVKVACREGRRKSIKYELNFRDGSRRDICSSSWRSNFGIYAAILEVDDCVPGYIPRETENPQRIREWNLDPEIQAEYNRRFAKPAGQTDSKK